MPLKHFTETFLIVVLAFVVALTGLLIATLPSLPEGALPWTVLFVLSIAYPLCLHSLFQRRRADNFFRRLHWFPAAMLLVWLLLQGIALGSSIEQSQVEPYSWGWTLGAVAVGFVAIVAFVLKVIRRRVPRLAFLALIFIPFAAAAFASEQQGNWEEQLASMLWQQDFWNVDGSGLLANWIDTTADSESGANLDPSENPDEEAWRERLRMQKKREERIEKRMHDAEKHEDSMATEDDDDMNMAGSLSSKASSSNSSNRYVAASFSSKPSKLPESGFGWSAIIVLLIAGYSAVLHDRARKRV